MKSQDEKNVIRGRESFALPNISYGQYTLDKLRNNPFRNVQVDGQTGQIVTNREILVKSVKLAAVLHERGVKVGDTVAISAENHVYWSVAACAAIFGGAVVVPINPGYSRGEVVHCLKIAKPKIIFVSGRSEASISHVNESLPWPMEIIELDQVSLSRRIPCLDDILSESRAWPDPYKYNATNIERPDKETMVILYSSGTTGMPKGVMLSHWNFFVQEFAILDRDFINFDQSDVILSVVPFFHGYGFIMMMNGLHVGSTAVTMSSFNPEIYLDLIGKYRVSIVLVVPHMLNFFAKSPIVPRYDYSSLKTVICGAAPLLPKMGEEALRRLGNPILRLAYGMTELSVVISISRRETRKPETVGTLLPGASCKVIDLQTSASLRPGQTGEMCFKGDQVMLGYKDNPEATRETIDEGGWLHTGDIGYYDEDGDLFIVGRLKELIKYKGFQVSPSEIESLLLTHPSITDAAVVGRPDETSGELPMAFVVRREPSDLTAEDVCNFVAGQVSSQSRLRGGVRFMKAIPRNPSGKILRGELLKIASKL